MMRIAFWEDEYTVVSGSWYNGIRESPKNRPKEGLVANPAPNDNGTICLQDHNDDLSIATVI